MADLPPIVQEFRADPDHLIRFARIVEKHFGALADDLELLRSGQAPDVEVPHVGPDGMWRDGFPSWHFAPCPHCGLSAFGKSKEEAFRFLAEHRLAEHQDKIQPEIAEAYGLGRDDECRCDTGTRQGYGGTGRRDSSHDPHL